MQDEGASAYRFDILRGRDRNYFGNADLFQKFRDGGWRDCHIKSHAGEQRTFFRDDQNFMLDHAYVDEGPYPFVTACDSPHAPAPTNRSTGPATLCSMSNPPNGTTDSTPDLHEKASLGRPAGSRGGVVLPNHAIEYEPAQPGPHDAFDEAFSHVAVQFRSCASLKIVSLASRSESNA